jgi:hypothetical protein
VRVYEKLQAYKLLVKLVTDQINQRQKGTDDVQQTELRQRFVFLQFSQVTTLDPKYVSGISITKKVVRTDFIEE